MCDENKLQFKLEDCDSFPLFSKNVTMTKAAYMKFGMVAGVVIMAS